MIENLQRDAFARPSLTLLDCLLIIIGVLIQDGGIMLVADVMQAEVELLGELRVVALDLRHHGLGEAVLLDALGQVILCLW